MELRSAPAQSLPFKSLTQTVHPVSITRFPLRRFSPGAGLLRNLFVPRYWRKIFQGLGPKRRESSNGDRVYCKFQHPLRTTLLDWCPIDVDQRGPVVGMPKGQHI